MWKSLATLDLLSLLEKMDRRGIATRPQPSDGSFSAVHHTPRHPLLSYTQAFSHINSTWLALIGPWVCNHSPRCPIVALLRQRASAGRHTLAKLMSQFLK